jgi:hypothetical protein
MIQSRREHWNQVYGSKPADTVSWFQAEPTTSIELIGLTGLGAESPVIDVGGGASVLVDRLIDKGFDGVTVLDISGAALDVARRRLGHRAASVTWLDHDVTTWEPAQGAYAIWHDRAVFHFLIDDGDKHAYLKALGRGLRVGGYLIIAAFSETGPEKCSGLTVQRYSAVTLKATLGPSYDLIEERCPTHFTPAGGSQDFIFCLFRKTTD